MKYISTRSSSESLPFEKSLLKALLMMVDFFYQRKITNLMKKICQNYKA